MSPYDVLMSHAIALKKELEQYLDEFEPKEGDEVIIALNQAIIKMNNMCEESNARKIT